jgi:hypothetical protein
LCGVEEMSAVTVGQSSGSVVEPGTSMASMSGSGGWPEGWYPDPCEHWEQRWWSGSSWTSWVRSQELLAVDPLVRRRALGTDDLVHLSFAERILLPELAARGALTDDQADRVRGVVRDLRSEAIGSLPVPGVAGASHPDEVGQPSTGRAQAVGVAPASAASAWVAAPVPEASAFVDDGRADLRVRAPGPMATWWSRTRESVASDLAVHGLAYLGVLMFFVGAFGLVAFAFGDVQRELRPVAEVVIAAVPFATAALLLRRGALVVGRALEVVGGLLVPVMLTTSLLDGVAAPPDLTGTALAVTLTLSCAAIAGAYAAWAHRHPDSGLRYVVAPMVWFTVAMACLGLGRPIPQGEAVAIPGAAQLAATIAALVATVAWARWRPRAALSEPTLVAAVPGLFILSLLALLTWVAAEVPAVLAVGAAAVLVVVGLQLLSPRLAPAVPGAIEPLWWSLACLALAPGLGRPAAAAVAVVGFVIILELAGRSRRPGWAVVIPGLLAAGLVPSTVERPWLTVGVLAAASVWALVRRLAPFEGRWAIRALDLAAGILPPTAVLALGLATSMSIALAVGAALVAISTVPATRPLLVRDAQDRFWRVLWTAGLGLVALASVVQWAFLAADAAVAGSGDVWLVAASMLSVALAAAWGPLSPWVRPWVVLSLGSWAWVLACAAGEVADAVRGGVLSLAALAILVVVHLATSLPGASRSHTGLAGHALAMAALPLAGAQWGLVLAIGLASVGWAVTAAFDARTHSPVGDLIGGLNGHLRLLPPALAALGMPVMVLTGLDTAGISSPTWVTVVLAATALAYATSMRAFAPSGPVGATLVWGSFLAGLLAVAGAPAGSATVLGLAALIAAVAILPTTGRPSIMLWTAWAAAAPLVGVALAEWSAALASVPGAVLWSSVLVAVGGAMLVCTCAWDLRFGPWVARWQPRRSSLLPPVVLGAGEVVAGGLLALGSAEDPARGWLLLVAAGVLLATALLARLGIVGGTGVVVAWFAALLIAGPVTTTTAWAAVLVAAVLLGAAELAHRFVADRAWWSRWDVPLLISAGVVAVTALASASGSSAAPVITVLVGVEMLTVAWRLRSARGPAWGLGTLGSALVLAGAWQAGGLWLAAALLVLAAGLTGLATRNTGNVRILLQVGGAVAAGAAWASAMDTWAWSAQQACDVTAIAAGAVTVAGAAIAWNRRVDRSWVLAWSSVAAVMVGAAALAAQLGASTADTAPSSAIVIGLALVAVACFAAATPLRIDGLRDLGVVWAFASLAGGFQVGSQTESAQVAILSGISVLCALLLLLAARTARTWVRTLVEVGSLTSVASVTVALWPSANPALLVPALAVAALQAAAIGSVQRVVWVQMSAPVLACASWLAFAAESLTGNAQWITVPIGLATLVIVGLWRRDRAARSLPTASTEIVVVESVGMAFLVAASFVQAVTISIAYAVLAMALGLGIAGWGLATRVRRRLLAGVLVTLAGAVFVVVVPLVRLLPSWGGAGLWILIAGMGILAVLVATFLEQGRTAIRAGLGRFSEETKDWE